ncbi:hypothetical protein ACO0QE_000009 [Hanseniaspora vineae]
MNVGQSLELKTIHSESFLFTNLVQAYLGERASEVINVLISKGRLNCRDISRLTKIDYKTVKKALISLIQLKCVSYFEDKDTLNGGVSSSNQGNVYYSYNEEGIVTLLYSGEIISQVTKLYSNHHLLSKNSSYKLIGEILQNVLQYGSLNPSDFIASLTNDNTSTQIYQTIFIQLVEDNFLVPIKPIDYCPIQDLWHLLYTKEYKAIPKSSTLSDLKKREQAKGKAKESFNKLTDRSYSSSSNAITTDKKTLLRKIGDDVYLTFNLQRYFKHKRSNHLVQLCASTVGKIPSKILESALRYTERSSPNVCDPLSKTGLLEDLSELEAIKDELTLQEEKNNGVTFNAIDISKILNYNVVLQNSLLSKLKDKSTKNKNNKRKQANSSASNKKIKLENGATLNDIPEADEHEAENEDGNDDNDDDDDDDDDILEAQLDSESSSHSIPLINAHLKLLSDPNAQVQFLRESRAGLYYVPYSSLTPLLKCYTYDALIESTLGLSALRLLRSIRINRLVTEKTLNNLVLFNEKDVRSILSKLLKCQSVEIQEMPRTMDRAASRSVFLFRNNQQHALQFMEKNLCWNIANLIFKTELLKKENQILLEKAEREDVKGREEELLLSSELNQLKMVNERELNSLTRMNRLISLWEVFKFL